MTSRAPAPVNTTGRSFMVISVARPRSVVAAAVAAVVAATAATTTAAVGDARRRDAAIAALRALSQHAEHHAARAALEQFEGDRPRAFAEDEISPLLRAAVRRDERALPRLCASGLLGPLPELLGLAPGRRVILLSSENAVLVEDHGDLWLRPGPPRWAPPLLRLLSRGASKEAIVAGLWGLRRYFPDRHDPLVRTTIHRLRAFLEPRGEWVTVTSGGYGLAASVHVIGANAAEPIEAPLVEVEDEALDDPLPAPRVATRAAAVAIDPATADGRVLERLRRDGEMGVPELSRALDLSESTALRALRRLVRGKQVARSGKARATRYRAR